MFKIAAFIKFDEKFEKRVLHRKKKVKQKFGNQTYLNHPVHLTLFTLKIKKTSELKKIYLNVSKKPKKIKLNINSTGIFFNDPLTKGNTIFYSLANNFALKNLQMKNLKLINNKIYVSKKDTDNFDNKILKDNYKKFGFPFSGKIWKPHITIASIKTKKQDNLFIKKFLNEKINHKIFVKNIEFYRVSGDNHYLLFKTNIF